MVYTPPTGNAVAFNFTVSGYTPPAGNALTFAYDGLRATLGINGFGPTASSPTGALDYPKTVDWSYVPVAAVPVGAALPAALVRTEFSVPGGGMTLDGPGTTPTPEFNTLLLDPPGTLTLLGGQVIPGYNLIYTPGAGSLTFKGEAPPTSGYLVFRGGSLTYDPITAIKNTAVGVEVAHSDSGLVHVSFTVAEVIHNEPTVARVSYTVAEVIHNEPTVARVSTSLLEIVRTTTSLPTECVVSALGIEVLRDVPSVGGLRPVLFAVY